MSNSSHFKPGNQAWRLAKKPLGVSKKYTADELWEKFEEYIEANSEYAWEKDDFIKSGPEAGKIVTMYIPNPPSIQMFCLFAQISEQTFNSYRKSSDLAEVSLAIASNIQGTQIGGAAVNTYNSNIIARWAGLVDKKEVDIKADMTDDERADMIKNIMEKIRKE